ncbi:hypothetical protein Mapa_001969 [Marchantia paleacea]|nr:hypothetical protein Mapa_001969 [Marchantia paleacea]
MIERRYSDSDVSSVSWNFISILKPRDGCTFSKASLRVHNESSRVADHALTTPSADFLTRFFPICAVVIISSTNEFTFRRCILHNHSQQSKIFQPSSSNCRS